MSVPADRPPVSLMERRNEIMDMEELEQDVELEQPGSMFGPQSAMLGQDIQIIEDGDDVIVDFDPMDEIEGEFYDNLAEELDDADLGPISSELLSEYDGNKSSRSDWESAYTEGLELLGFNYEERTQPFRGATGVTHPLLAEAATQFQAQAFNELLPPNGPVRTTVLGTPTHEKMQQAQRVKDFMNYYITNVMEEYTPEFDQMLFYLPLVGSTFKKVYYDEGLGRAVSKFVPAENLVVPYEAGDLETCPNITQVLRMPLNELRKLQISGFYRDIPVLPSSDDDKSQVTDELDYMQGLQSSNIDYDVTLLECHVDLDLPGYEEVDEEGEPTGIKVPYIVTISQDSGQILSIRRNYREEDPLKKKIAYFVHYKFLPGFGFYGLGLIHTIGGLSRTATAALRQLIDAGTLSNLPAGFKARGLRIRDDNEPLQPGEFRDVDAPGGAIRDSLMPLPFKGPDQTLFQLLGFVVQAGQRFATITDMKVGDSNDQAAVGTTLAMIEQGSRVMSAVHKRIHYAMRMEFKILARVMKEYLPQEYPYSIENADNKIMSKDFDDRVDVLPVSNPNIFSQAQRIALAQAEMQLAMQAPELHNLDEVYRRMYDALGVKDIDKILKPRPTNEPVPKDPATENVESLEGMPLKAFEGQDHQAHIIAHMVQGATPMIQAMPKVAMDLQKHILEHVKLQASEQAAVEFLQANQGQPVAEEQMIEIEARIAQLIAEGMQALKQLSQAIAGGGEQQPDPLVALKERELQIRETQVQADIQQDQAELDFDRQRAQQKAAEFQQRISSQERQTFARIEAAAERERMRQLQEMRRGPGQ
jgi:hypothetical protein